MTSPTRHHFAVVSLIKITETLQRKNWLWQMKKRLIFHRLATKSVKLNSIGQWYIKQIGAFSHVTMLCCTICYVTLGSHQNVWSDILVLPVVTWNTRKRLDQSTWQGTADVRSADAEIKWQRHHERTHTLADRTRQQPTVTCWHWGRVIFLSHLGNRIKSRFSWDFWKIIIKQSVKLFDSCHW